MASFKELIVWQKGLDLTMLIYTLSNELRRSEEYNLCSQMRRAALAIPSNISEGHRRNNRKEFRQFCGIALGSGAELDTQLIITSRVYPNIDVSGALKLCTEVQKMLNSLVAKLK